MTLLGGQLVGVAGRGVRQCLCSAAARRKGPPGQVERWRSWSRADRFGQERCRGRVDKYEYSSWSGRDGRAVGCRRALSGGVRTQLLCCCCCCCLNPYVVVGCVGDSERTRSVWLATKRGLVQVMWTADCELRTAPLSLCAISPLIARGTGWLGSVK
ncbi:hypothetical protein T440DRAFT_231085 [Plenodomus tracheiphilus IPT5]|uniref:Uncharacterized protein n=1 Tax=Plenodomus tracheiphilus IPT5 TaxID=1408161 RepID=A0A6A7ATA4_9PLEO|nr:hypothetical protein T440DRAFT_231085 [Plenodomus tracheiphilus IPT5]